MADREMTNEEAIEILGGIRACYNIFDEYDEPKYAALSKAIFALKAEPVKHGRWIKNEDRSGWHCSCCGKDDLYAYPYVENNERELQDFYCPNCGAKMDEVENGGMDS